MTLQEIAWTVALPATREFDSPVEHPATTELLRATDGWTKEDVENFCRANDGLIVAAHTSEPKETR